MPRSGSGSCSLAEAPFIANTPISSADVNSDFADIIIMLTDSLSRTGDGGMQAVLELDNTGFTYTTDPNTGMRRTAGDTQAIECGGVDIVEFTSTKETVNGDLEVTGAITNGGVALLPIGFGPAPWSGSTAPSKWLLFRGQTLLRASYPDLWTFAAAEIALGNTLFTNGNGSTTFTLADATGRLLAGKEATATRLTANGWSGNSTILGSAGGVDSITLSTSEMPVHTHVITDPGHTHTSNAIAQTGGGGTIQPGTPGATATINSATTGITNQNAGSGNAHRNVQPTIIVNFIIYAGV